GKTHLRVLCRGQEGIRPAAAGEIGDVAQQVGWLAPAAAGATHAGSFGVTVSDNQAGNLAPLRTQHDVMHAADRRALRINYVGAEQLVRSIGNFACPGRLDISDLPAPPAISVEVVRVPMAPF
ncbi:MAG: hypothetical protein ABI040_00565, partial [Rhodoferax sp.]